MTYDRLEELSEMFTELYDEFMTYIIEENCEYCRDHLALLVDNSIKSSFACVNLINHKYAFNEEDEMLDMEEVHSHINGVITKVENKMITLINGDTLYRINVDIVEPSLKVSNFIEKGTVVGYTFLD